MFGTSVIKSMNKVMKEILVCTLMVFAISSYVLSSSEFKVTFWNICPQNFEELRTYVGISLYECIVSCSKRSSCEDIIYRRRGAVCHITRYLNIDTFVKLRIGCVVIAGECSCNEEQVCDNGMCIYEECPFPTISNGVTLGNTNAVGSSLKISCEATFAEINSQTSMECQLSGFWSYYPTCASVIECADLTFTNGELVGTDNGVGAVRSIVCNTGYREEQGVTGVICNSSGHWSYNPVCVSVCKSNSDYAKQEFHIKVFNTKSKTKSRDEANSYCTGDGGSLVKINESWKMEFVAGLLKNCSIFSDHEYWTDGKGNNDDWRFSDNTLVPMTNDFWHMNKPDDDDDDKCARLKNLDGQFLWDDNRCGNDMKFICEY